MATKVERASSNQCRQPAAFLRSCRFYFLQIWPNDTPFHGKDCRESIYAWEPLCEVTRSKQGRASQTAARGTMLNRRNSARSPWHPGGRGGGRERGEERGTEGGREKEREGQGRRWRGRERGREGTVSVETVPGPLPVAALQLPLCAGVSALQGYLAYKKTHLSRTLP